MTRGYTDAELCEALRAFADEEDHPPTVREANEREGFPVGDAEPVLVVKVGKPVTVRDYEDLDVVVEYDFHGGSRRQEAQRYGRVMHGETEGEHVILMTDAEYDKYSKRLLSLEEQGIRIIPERRE